MKHSLRVVFCTVALSIIAPSIAVAQVYPAKPVRVIVPFAPGGGSDIIARQVSNKLQEQFMQGFVIDNRGGAGGLIGMELAAKAPADGYTIIIMSGSFSTSAALQKPAFDPIRTIRGVAEIGYVPFVLAVHASLPVKTLPEFFKLARSRPGELCYASSGLGGITHLATELMASQAKVRFTHVPYKSTGAAMVDLLAGACQFILGSLPPMLPQIQAGKMRALAVSTAKPSDALPGVPVMSATLPGFEVDLWFGLLAPRDTPRPVVDALNEAVNRGLRDADLQKQLADQGMIASGGSPERFVARIESEYKRWSMVVEQAKIKVE
ncbi:MAG: tripartite tricarboxylate transporter substrate binding protein [Proteobacteria bacterium]|nr:tripartite tricarboxylate transporter substrate binding protein [Burkholderiales bacterium]